MKLLSFIGVPEFTKRLDEIGSLDILFEIQADLLASPTRWPVIAGTHGVRKGRAGDKKKGKGKRGSFRYLYYYIEYHGVIYLIYIFAKKEQDNLTQAQKDIIAQLADEIQESINERTHEEN